jgi:hypothetical protein
MRSWDVENWLVISHTCPPYSGFFSISAMSSVPAEIEEEPARLWTRQKYLLHPGYDPNGLELEHLITLPPSAL